MSKIEGVASVDVNFDEKTATVSMEPGKTLTKEQCEKAFTGTSYKVAAFDAAPA